MITTLKLAGLSAILSAGLVSGFSAPDQNPASHAGKLFYDRPHDASAAAPVILASVDSRARVVGEVNGAAKGDRIRIRDEVRCTDQAWLLVPADCVPNFDISSARTSEIRGSGNVSALVRGGGGWAFASR